MTTIKEIAWVAGLLEGEGWFGYPNHSPRIVIGSTDIDVLLKFRLLVAPHLTKPLVPASRGMNAKEIYYVTVCGGIAIQWMMTIYALMGARRRVQMKNVIQQWKVNGRKDRKCYGS
jgi:hypothetical protein